MIQGTGTIGKNVVLTQTQLLVDLDTASMKVSGDLTIEASAELRFLNVAPNGNHLQVTGMPPLCTATGPVAPAGAKTI